MPSSTIYLTEEEEAEWRKDSMNGARLPMKPEYLWRPGDILFQKPEEWLAHKREFQARQARQAYEAHRPKVHSKLAGRNSILADIGSRINIIGEETDREFRRQAEAKGLKVIYEDIPTLKVGGVGQGHTECYKKATYPVAIDFKNGGRKIHTFTANVATGHAARLPAIYGLESM